MEEFLQEEGNLAQKLQDEEENLEDYDRRRDHTVTGDLEKQIPGAEMQTPEKLIPEETDEYISGEKAKKKTITSDYKKNL